MKLKFKSQTPHQIAISGSLISSIGLTILLLLAQYYGEVDFSNGFIFIFFILAFLLDYLANFYFIRYFIFRKIKLIYKIIHNFKLPSDFKVHKIRMRDNILDDVEAEVDEWAKQQSIDIKRLEELAAYRRRFIGDVSHELKTPIFNIQGFLHTLLDGGLEDPEINVKYLERAASNVERLEHIVEDLETINRLESGQILLEPDVFSIKSLADQVFEDNELTAEQKNIEFEYKLEMNFNYQVYADKESIRQVLMNLVTNAIKYGRAGGLVKIGFYDMDKKILIEVSDDGIGIAKKHLPHVFDRFYRVDKSRSRDAGGTGLGLSIVKHIIEAHKETLNVRSTIGKGTTFGFTLKKA